MESIIERNILAFINTIERINTSKAGSNPSIHLIVNSPKWKEDKITFMLEGSFYDGAYHQSVRGASLEELEAEILRRLGFADRQAVKNDQLIASFTALEWTPPD